MAFLQLFVSQQLVYCFYFQNIWIQYWMWQIVGLVAQIFANYTLALRSRVVAAKIDCARPCFFFQEEDAMQWHHYDERFLSSSYPAKETMCPRSEDAKVHKVDVQKRDTKTFIYLFLTVWWRVEKPQPLKDDVEKKPVCIYTIKGALESD